MNRRSLIGLAAACLLAAVALPAASGSSADRAMAILASAKSASGGAAWDNVTGWHERGTHGDVAYETLLDLHQEGSLFKETKDGQTSTRGFNGAVAWEQKPDGQVSQSTEPARLADARLSWYASASAFFFPERFPARFADLGKQTDGKTVYDRLRITPAGGNPFELWIDRSTHLVARLVDRTGPKPLTATVGGYEEFDGLKLPTGFTVGDATPGHAQQAQILSYELTPVPRATFDPPAHP